MIYLLAFLSMYCEDIVGVCMVQAESRNSAVLAGLGDVFMYLFAWCVQYITLKSGIQNGFDATTIALLAVVSLANFTGTVSGVHLGRRFIRDKQNEQLLQRIAELEAVVFAK